jgi:hypothetical protein
MFGISLGLVVGLKLAQQIVKVRATCAYALYKDLLPRINLLYKRHNKKEVKNVQANPCA